VRDSARDLSEIGFSSHPRRARWLKEYGHKFNSLTVARRGTPNGGSKKIIVGIRQVSPAGGFERRTSPAGCVD
jgi:hypothetical protein